MATKKISVYACATKENTQVKNFLQSFKLHDGWDLHLVGMGLKWNTFRTKMECYRSSLQQVHPDEIVVCLDAYDAVCVSDSRHFQETFFSYQTSILIGYEPECCFTLHNRFFQIGCCPNIDKWKHFHGISTKDAFYVNSGCIVGYAGEIYKMFEWILNYPTFPIKDDQVGVGMYMNEFPSKVKLDLDRKFVFNDNFGENLHFKMVGKNQIEIDIPYKPFFIHFPGIKYMFKETNYQILCSMMLDKHIPLHETIHRDFTIHFYCILGIFVIVLVLFMIHRKK